MKSKLDDLSFEELGNTAWLKYKAAEPLNMEEAAIIAGVNLDIWEPIQQKANMWTVGRKDKKVSLDIIDGVATGTVEDSGEFHKEYMFQMKVEFTRKERIPVIPVLSPVEIKSSSRRSPKPKIVKQGKKKHILFITDPHFGFLVKPFEKPVTFHSRIFLSDLLSLLAFLDVEYVVWGGDILDLADFSRWPKKPEIIQKTQIAAIEAAWVISQFGKRGAKQKIIEGNHDVRMVNATAQNFAAAYELKPVHDLAGPALLSVPRLLELDKNPDIEWFGGYPDSYFDIGGVRFEHGGPAAPSDSGATVTKLLKQMVKTTFFGHIHRYERATKHIDGQDTPIIAATPGCACRKEYTPGAGRKRNWSIGAFYITLDDSGIPRIEDIIHEAGRTYFRGEQYKGTDYILKMGRDIPSKYMSAL